MADQGPSIIPPFTKPVWPIRDHASCVQWPFANGCTSAPMLGRSKLMWSARRAFQFDSSNSVVLCSMALYKRVHKCLPRAIAPVGLPLLFPCWASPARNSAKVLCKCGSARASRTGHTSLLLCRSGGVAAKTASSAAVLPPSSSSLSCNSSNPSMTTTAQPCGNHVGA